ncbi:MAG: FABP family protein [Candidatus Nanopelagicales bacterium]|nr:FABP family protein [Actinomycetota bacterium]MCB0920549.1 FABP family protein [Actinomycetota bacterium]TXH32730.1 MAG: FABP family protein [Actinomycetota bacterium]HNE90120.1 FABP family protein [Actinomycetota bacterium]HNL52707.1 FABP family protein [Actinomycetota bacterium]
MDLPEELLPLSWLLGQWVGVGTGQYPTIEDFRFGQELSFTCDGRPFIAMNSRSWILDADGNRERPGAMESAYFRPRPDNEFEALFIHPTGYTEVWHGKVTVSEIQDATITRASLEMTTDSVMRTASAKEYLGGQRLYGLAPDGDLAWTFDMAAVGEPLSNHLAAKLKSV